MVRGRKPAFLSVECRPTDINSDDDKGTNTVVLTGTKQYEITMAKRPIRLEDIPLSALEASPEHIGLVREEVERLGRQRTVWIGILNSLESAAKLPITSFGEETEPARIQVQHRPPRNKRENPTQPVKPMVFHQGSWAHTIHTVLTEAGRPLAFAEVREAISKTPLGPKLEDNKLARSYHSTVQRLKEGGYVVDHNGGITTPDVLRHFLAEVAAGRAVDVQFARYRNKYTEAIYRFLKTKPEGASLFDIMEHLRSVEGFTTKGSPDHQKAYVITLLRKLIHQSKSVTKPERGFYKLAEFDDASTKEGGLVAENERATEGDLLSVARH